MGRALALAVVFLVVPHGAIAAPARRAPAARPAAARSPHRARHAARKGGPPTLAEAKAAMTALQRDRARRRYHHNWERAIQDLLRAARGKDAPAATLEAARARYALYRWSANEADRDAALRLAARATRQGSREAAALAAAIRREAGEDRPARPPPAHPAPQRARTAVAAAPAPPPEPAEDDAPQDPALEAALADLSAARTTPALPLGASDGEGPARVSEVRTWSSDDYTRVAVYLSHWVGWQKLELQPAPDRPRRIALDLRPALLEGAAVARPVPGERIDRVRAAQNAPDTVRVVLDLAGADGVEVFALDDPPRLVLDVGTNAARREAVARAGRERAEPQTPTPTPSATSTPRPEAAAEPAPDEGAEEPQGPIRRIVVDAGHGGHDPGAIGPRRVREKDVTLAMARRLAKRLREAGFEVVLTRKDDRYLALEERTAIANTARGDLFVSIHANAHPRRNRTGVETYFLNVTDDRYAARLAARENGLDLDGQGDAVTRILTDLDAKASAGASRRLARLVQREVTGGVRAHVGDVRDLGVKSALFYVLLGARMPAVLVETAFISNRDEERRLASPRYQDEVAAGIARAVAGFARSGPEVAAARAP
ncbi:MAG TPA: N-acetylmuramoyl-L-alanine amidase [Anaeromyxobacter sp.]